ncbi:Alpha-N-acetylglucosaminidase [Lamellibrachia satsuma]|nr:Alpha-N-acetylglucosaminidase [Lamellibrachia satsuma]
MGLCILVVLACCLVANAKDFRTLHHLQPSATNDVQTAAAQELILRVVKGRASRFVVNVDPSIGPKNRDTFMLVTDSGRLNITGTTGVAVAMGFNYYLSQYCGCHISWGGNQVNFPSELPVIAAPGIVVTSNDKLRYFSNVCTMSYSFAWWRWLQWETFIDWLAMSGFNMPLAFNAQEAIWQRIYLKMGFTQRDLNKHFAGPAFLAWQRMGNLYGWGGPLPQSWHGQQVALQHKILTRMRSLGMLPVLPAFAGHVPAAFPRLFPNHNVSHMTNWGSFNSSYCCTLLLDAHDPMFTVIGKAFLLEYSKEFGTDHLYNADNFNEMTPKSR